MVGEDGREGGCLYGNKHDAKAGYDLCCPFLIMKNVVHLIIVSR